MRIIIEVKDTATLDRIDRLSKELDIMYRKERVGRSDTNYSPVDGYSDVIKSISKEW